MDIDREVIEKVMRWVGVEFIDTNIDFDIADAWKVVEKMAAQGIIIFLTPNDFECSTWQCEFKGYGYDGRLKSWWCQEAGTAPLAIYQAAFKVLEDNRCRLM